MKVVVKNNHKVVTPSDGMWLTNGEVISDGLFMPLDADTSQWREITEEEKLELEAKLESEVNDETE